MEYISTRGGVDSPLTGTAAIVQGLAPDGGLFVPQELPRINYQDLKGMTYPQMAVSIIHQFFPEISEDRLEEMVEIYAGKFDDDRITPVTSFEKVSYLELFHGPTASFKDMALSLLPNLMRESYIINDLHETIFVLVATSGDTGSAALEGFSGKEGVEIAVFYPEVGVSELQMTQMEAAASDNAHVYAINGNFDDAQRAVKQLYYSEEIQALETAHAKRISSANSINIGRLVPQIVYYFFAYHQLVENGQIEDGEKIDISVPTGNFGDILAGIYAKYMGLPIEKVICASNSNNVLTDFLKSGVYDANRTFHKTISPSMDILVSSNLERFLYLSSHGDSQAIAQAYQDLKEKGRFTWPHKIPDFMEAKYLTDEETMAVIRQTFEESHYLLDPHTAVAAGARDLSDNHCLVVATASPFKFSESVIQALGYPESSLSLADRIQVLAQLSDQEIPVAIQHLLILNLQPQNQLGKDDIQEEVIHLLEGL